MDIKQLRRRFDRLSIVRETAVKRLDQKTGELAQATTDIEDFQIVSKILRQIGTAYRTTSVQRIEDLVTRCLQAVFEREYEFVVRMVEKREQIETEFFVRDGEIELDPEFQAGGGILDVISLGLRAVMWSMRGKSATDSFLALDEPARNVSASHIENVSEMLDQLARQLGIQFLIVTHREGLTYGVDRIFKVDKIGEFSRVEEESRECA